MNEYSCVALAFSIYVFGAVADWDYSDPSKWKDTYKKCGLSSQTPVDIKGAKCDSALNKSLTIMNYNMAGSFKFKLQNTGGTLKITPDSSEAKILVKGVGTFKFAQLHFHWGDDDTKGSEHFVNGKKYPAELHFVHYNYKYADIGTALPEPDGLAVLGVFLKVGRENPAYNKFLNWTKYNISEAGTYVKMDPFALNELLPKNTDNFYRYSGSLTTPTCDESVTWTVFHEEFEVSADQLAAFRMLEDKKGDKLVNNFRPIQPLNGRPITYWNSECPDDGGPPTGIPPTGIPRTGSPSTGSPPTDSRPTGCPDSGAASLGASLLVVLLAMVYNALA